ncbi:hypothetical protein CBR_g8863 [Chara braunii]|uniref:Uncharacterized protein n=1 Tax=Chara braunii TaxID=69332 RepID=A0A388KN03_CHABU|nr:hypothetical protein CBR_g8863 [Chara braunii]|eukprot:GBG71444.1 hypothetical protein CBR_g8863 [Chara braunii]
MLRRQIDDLTTTIATMKEKLDDESKKKEKKAKCKQENLKLEQKRREEEARSAEKQARQEAERRKKRKEEKLKKIVEDRELMKKELRMEVFTHMGSLREELPYLRERGAQQAADATRTAKGKKKVVMSSSSSDDGTDGSYESDVEALSNQAEQLVISEKRKRGEDLPDGDSLPLETPARKTAKRRLHLSVKHPPMKRPPTGRASRRCATSMKKIPAPPRSCGKLKYVIDNLRALGKLNVEDLTRLCAQEGVQLGTECRKMQIILALADKRTQVAYGDEVQGLRECKAWMEHEGTIEIRQLRRWKPKSGPDKKFMVSILRHPYPVGLLKTCSLDALIRMNGVAADFQKASTTAFLRRLISRAVKDAYGWSLNARLIARVKFDDRIKLVEVRTLLNDRIEELEIPICMRNLARSNIRIVWVKNPSITCLLHNQRAFTKVDVLTCACACLPYPRVGDHVRFRLQELDDVDPLIFNANNFPRHVDPNRVRVLCQELTNGISSWAKFRGPMPTISESDAVRCMPTSVERTRFIDVNTVKAVKARLNGLVLTPLDRNPGETLVLCPKVYFEAMMKLFVTSPGYVVSSMGDKEVKCRMRVDAKAEGLLPFVRWDKKGKFGEAYAMPKHKDLTRFRPICLTFEEPTVKTCRAVAKTLNHLLNTFPARWHFNLKSVSVLVPTLEAISKKIGLRIEGSSPPIALSYDIKDMFFKLPHVDIIEAVDWIVDYHCSKGREFVRVNTRGRYGVTLPRIRGEGEVTTEFFEIYEQETVVRFSVASEGNNCTRKAEIFLSPDARLVFATELAEAKDPLGIAERALERVQRLRRIDTGDPVNDKVEYRERTEVPRAARGSTWTIPTWAYRLFYADDETVRRVRLRGQVIEKFPLGEEGGHELFTQCWESREDTDFEWWARVGEFIKPLFSGQAGDVDRDHIRRCAQEGIRDISDLEIANLAFAASEEKKLRDSWWTVTREESEGEGASEDSSEEKGGSEEETSSGSNGGSSSTTDDSEGSG